MQIDSSRPALGFKRYRNLLLKYDVAKSCKLQSYFQSFLRFELTFEAFVTAFSFMKLIH